MLTMCSTCANFFCRSVGIYCRLVESMFPVRGVPEGVVSLDWREATSCPQSWLRMERVSRNKNLDRLNIVRYSSLAWRTSLSKLAKSSSEKTSIALRLIYIKLMMPQLFGQCNTISEMYDRCNKHHSVVCRRAESPFEGLYDAAAGSWWGYQKQE